MDDTTRRPRIFGRACILGVPSLKKQKNRTACYIYMKPHCSIDASVFGSSAAKRPTREMNNEHENTIDMDTCT